MTASAYASRLGHDRLVLADLVPGARVRDAALIVVGAGLTGLSAQVSLHAPWTPVPFTLQTLAVLLVGASLGSIRGVLSMVLYVLAGAAGMPWYAGHASGWGGPTYGYVLGFIAAAGAVGYLAERRGDRTVMRTIFLMVAGNVIVYLFGASWLALDLHVSASQAFDFGVRPFFGSDLVKIVVAAGLLPGAWRLVGRERDAAR